MSKSSPRLRGKKYFSNKTGDSQVGLDLKLVRVKSTIKDDSKGETKLPAVTSRKDSTDRATSVPRGTVTTQRTAPTTERTAPTTQRTTNPEVKPKPTGRSASVGKIRPGEIGTGKKKVH